MKIQAESSATMVTSRGYGILSQKTKMLKLHYVYFQHQKCYTMRGNTALCSTAHT